MHGGGIVSFMIYVSRFCLPFRAREEKERNGSFAEQGGGISGSMFNVLG